MTLLENFDDPLATTGIDRSVNLNSLYCSHLWTNSNLRNAVLKIPSTDNAISYCYTCKGKIRKYELKSSRNFTPHNHSTPNKHITIESVDTPVSERTECPIDKTADKAVGACHSIPTDFHVCNAASESNKQRIPSISQQIDSSFRQKYTSYEIETDNVGRRRLSKSLRGFGCIINFASTDSTLKKSTQIQACSISVMIIAIVIISFILVNFTRSNFKGGTNLNSTSVVPTKITEWNQTASAITDINSDLHLLPVNNTEDYITMTEYPSDLSTENNTDIIINVISKIRKNIRTYPKSEVRKEDSAKPKDINNRDLSQRFCSCQKNEICMLDENSGTSICRKSADIDDPTGCGGLCALETEACQLVDRARGVRVCRLITLVTCSPDEWRCRNGFCVPTEARCDGSIQCYDRSDEMYCDCDLTKQFRCGHSISCFPHTKLCDGVVDCLDGYDEVNCTANCPDDQFTCNDGQCILASRFCDGLADCADHSDEPDGCGGDCAAHEIRCKNQRCVPRVARCNGHDNCGDGTDEQQCSE